MRIGQVGVVAAVERALHESGGDVAAHPEHAQALAEYCRRKREEGET